MADEELVKVGVASKDGSRKLDVSIRRILPTGRLVQPTLQLMTQHFIPRETMNTLLGFTLDQENTVGLREGWMHCISQGNCMAAVLSSDAVDSEPVVVAANITYVVEKDDKDIEFKHGGRALKTIGEVLKQMDEACNICSEYNVEAYLTAMGLGVDSEYHGLGLGYELLKAREELCKIIGITCSATVFTSSISQHLATKAGFSTAHSIKYTDVVVNGEKVFHKAKPDMYIKLMARTYKN